MAPLFIYATLLHRPLLAVVTGREMAPLQTATLEGFRLCIAGADAVRTDADEGAGLYPDPVLVSDPGGAVVGGCLSGVTDEELARVDYFMGPAYIRKMCPVTPSLGASDDMKAWVYLPVNAPQKAVEPWDFALWAALSGPLITQAAIEYMEGFGRIPVAQAQAHWTQMLVRAASWLRAQARPAPAKVRSAMGRDTVEVQEKRRPYSAFFTVEEQDLRFPRFTAGKSGLVTRAAMVAGDAVTVMPYDPVRDRVLVIEQFRFGPFVRGDLRPWALEPPAGRIDPGETPEHAARRELFEETGLAAGELFRVADYYPSPGAWSEFLFSYVALAALPDGAAGIGGVADEEEDIKSHILDFDTAFSLLETGEAQTAPLVMSLLWLQGQRARLRGVA